MLNTLKIFIRSLKRKKTRSIITIGGYAVSMAVTLLLVSFIIGEKTVNEGFENGDNIYRIKRSDEKSIVPITLRDDVKSKIPGVEKMCFYGIRERLYKRENKQEMAKFIATNDDFLEMFSFHFIHKSANPTLSLKENVILTQKFSKKLFGTENPVGKVLEINQKSFTIAGVVTDLPENSSFRFDAFINFELGPVLNSAYGFTEDHVLLNSFVLLSPRVNPDDVNKQISGMIGHWQAFKDIKLSIEPFSGVYFNSLSQDHMEHANVSMINLLTSVALVILFMTIFNYINMAVSSGYEQLNEIGIRKTTGAGKSDIFRQILTESLLVSLLAMMLAVIIAIIIAPVFSEILGKNIELGSTLSQPLIILSCILIFFITGILSGIYPALIFSRMSPLRMISHQKGFKRKGQMAGVVMVQFLITTVLIISLLFIQKQMEFVKNKDLGFDKEMMIRLDLNGLSGQKWAVMRNELLTNPRIISVSASSGSPMQIPGSSTNQFNIAGEEKMVEIKSFGIDDNFLETFGLKLIEGRNFKSSDTNVCMINEHLYRKLQWKAVEGQELLGQKVVGVVKDFHYENLYTEIGNLQLQHSHDYASVLNIKISGNVSETLEFIKRTYAKIEPGIPFSFRFYDDWIESMYLKQEKQATAIKVFALLAIVIACLGLFGLIEHITNKKIKEIGIRKINGASISEVIFMLNKNVVKWVVFAFIIAIPISYYIMHKWLENFAYKTELSWWIFALAGLVAMVIALLTVSWQSWRAATTNPVEALRNE